MKASSCANVEEVEIKINGSEKKTRGSCKSSSPMEKDSITSNIQVSTMIACERSSMDTSSRASPSNPKASDAVNQEDQLETTKAEMGEVREENERLKSLLARIVKDYQSLQMHFFDVVQQDQAKTPADQTPPPPAPCRAEEPEQLISLSLGTSSSGNKKEERTQNSTNMSKDRNDQIEDGLTLGLDCKRVERSSNISPSNSVGEAKEEEGEPWPPSKILKNMRSGEAAPNDEGSQQAHIKKTRVSVRARCDAPTMHDGCQWRKYGQKIAKGNPCPRAYYRCTVAPQCPVRKQVQRCSDDMSILITTYEGTHNHPLPISATAMASTTSAAACMLMSGSTSSRSPITGSPPSSSIPASVSNPNLHALNFNLSDPNQRPRPFYLPNSTISSTPSHPTITLDLTSPPQITTSQPSQFSRLMSPNFSGTPNTKYSTSFNFSASESNPSSLPTSWTNGSYVSYAAHQAYNRTPVGSLGLTGSLYQSYLQKANNPNGTQHVLTDTIAKAITSDPSFQSALAAAITSYVGSGPSSGAQIGGDLKCAEQHGSLAAPSSTAGGGNGCKSSFLTRTAGGGSATSGGQQGSLMFLQPALGLSASSKSTATASPVNNIENIK